MLSWLALTTVFGLILEFSYGLFGFLVWFEGWVVIPVAMVLAAVMIAAIPLERIGSAIDADLRGVHAQGQLRNIAEGVSVAVGVPAHGIMIHPSPIANVGGFPTSDGVVVMATAGAIHQLRRDELEALIAAQFAGMNDRWCRVATRAEIAWTLAKAISFASFVLAMPFVVFVGVGMIFVPRFVEATRDLCADVAAVRATRHPEALAAAMRRLAPAAVHSHAQKLGIRWFLPVSPFLVMPKRHKSTTTIGTDTEVTRRWTEADEVASELTLRADRATALAGGADPREFTGREFRKRWAKLGAT